MKMITVFKALIVGGSWLTSGGLKELKRRDRLWILPIALAGIILAGVSFLFILINSYNGLYELGKMTGHGELLSFYAGMGSLILLFLMGIPFCFSVLYFSEDIKLLVTLPLKESSIVGAKIGQLLLYFLPIHWFLMLPALIILGVRDGWTFSLIAGGLLNLFLGPFLPLLLALALVALLVRIVNVGRYKIFFEVTGMFLGLGLVLIFQGFLAHLFSSTGEMQVSALLPVLDKLMSTLIPIRLIALGISGSGLNLILSLGMYTVALFLGVVIGTKGFIRHYSERIFAGGFQIRRKKSSSPGIIRGPVSLLVRREWDILREHSIFLFEGVAEVMVFPLILLIFGFTMPGDFLEIGRNFLNDLTSAPLLVWGFLLFSVSLNGISTTSLSREGKNFALSLTLPLPGRVQIVGKMGFHMLLFGTAYLVNLLLVHLFLSLPLLHLVYLIPGGLAFVVLTFIISISVDLKHPVLNWTHPMQAMKQNLNMLIGLGFVVCLIALSAGIVFLFLQIGLKPFTAGGIFTLLLIGMDLLLLPWLFKRADLTYSGGIVAR